MKKVLFTVFIVALCLCLGVVCAAQEEGLHEEKLLPSTALTPPSEMEAEDKNSVSETIDVKAYIMDKIVPVAVAVLTSALAFLATLGTIAKSLKALKDTKEAFSDEAKERAVFFECGMEMLNEKAEELKEIVADVPELKATVDSLTQECRLNSEILTLGFSANSEVIKSGKGKRMAVLLENAKSKTAFNAKFKMQNAKLEQDGAEEMANETV